MLNKVIFAAAMLLGVHAYARADAVSDYMMRKKVVVDTAKAELCFTDDKQCHPVLIGKTTPKGTFDLRLMKTSKPGYGGEVIGFKEQNHFLFALHRVWTRIPSERRMERIASPVVADRIMTNGCINVTDKVYEKLRGYFTLEVI